MQSFSMWTKTFKKISKLHKQYCAEKDERVFISWFFNEIVEEYVIDKEKCQWIEKKRLLYNSGCSSFYQGETKSPDFKYCPYCGKEIIMIK